MFRDVKSVIQESFKIFKKGSGSFWDLEDMAISPCHGGYPPRYWRGTEDKLHDNGVPYTKVKILCSFVFIHLWWGAFDIFTPCTTFKHKIVPFLSFFKDQIPLFHSQTQNPITFRVSQCIHHSGSKLQIDYEFFVFQACFSSPNFNFTLWHLFDVFWCDLNCWFWSWLIGFDCYWFNYLSHDLNWLPIL